MKKYFLMFITGSLLACGGNNNSNEQGETSGSVAQEPARTEAQTETQTDAQVEDGRQLIQSSDCKACHMDDSRIIGPSYLEVAEKYQENDTTIAYLANKIIQGGSGNWGEVPMTPHPQHSTEEAEQMVKYILSLND